jgi:hypothetical protein
MTTPLGSHGTIVKMGALGGGGPYTAVAETVDSTGVSVEQSIHDAPAQERAWMKKVAGIMNAKDFSLDVHFIPKHPTHNESTGLLSLLGNVLPTGFELVYPDAGAGTASKWTFNAYLSGWDGTNAVDGIMDGTATFAVDGEPVPSAGS